MGNARKQNSVESHLQNSLLALNNLLVVNDQLQLSLMAFIGDNNLLERDLQLVTCEFLV